MENEEESSLMQFSCLEMCWKLNQTIKKQKKTLMSEAREELKTMDEEEMKARRTATEEEMWLKCGEKCTKMFFGLEREKRSNGLAAFKGKTR